MKRKIKDIAEISTGVYTKPVESPDVVAINVRDIDETGQLSKQLSPTVSGEKIAEHHFLQKNDILLSARGSFQAILYQAEFNKAVAANSFLVLRLKDKNRVSAPYLHWFLNHPRTQRFIEHLAQGNTKINYLSKKKAEEIQIPILDKETQRSISEFDNLVRQEQDLMEKIKNRKKHLYQGMMVQKIKNK